MHSWRAACKSKFRIPSLINIKQIIDVIGPYVSRCFLFFIVNTGRTSDVSINMVVLAMWER